MKVSVALTCALLTIGGAYARDNGQYGNVDPAIHKWFEDQHNSTGQWCCNEADGHQYDGEYAFDADGNVTISIEGQTIKVDSSKVLQGPNPTGHAVVWYLMGPNAPTVFCFASGSLT